MAVLSAVFALAFSACAIPTGNPADPAGKQGMIDATNVALSQGNCALAVQTITPLYNSPYTDDNVRTITASAYACFANIELFPLIGNLGNSASSFGGGAGFWSTLAQLFPSKSQSADSVVEGAALGMDALEAVLIPGQPILPSDEFNTSTYNPGSFVASDRTANANFLLFFTTLAEIGGLENRYGAPNPSFQKTVNLPWTNAASILQDTEGGNGCEFASGVVNMIDTLAATLSSMTGGLANGGNSIQTALGTAISDACDYGCQNTTPSAPLNAVYDPSGGWVQSGCTTTTACPGCPAALRNRSSCTGEASDQTSCAAAGIINMVNLSVMGWQTGA